MFNKFCSNNWISTYKRMNKPLILHHTQKLLKVDLSVKLKTTNFQKKTQEEISVTSGLGK